MKKVLLFIFWGICFSPIMQAKAQESNINYDERGNRAYCNRVYIKSLQKEGHLMDQQVKKWAKEKMTINNMEVNITVFPNPTTEKLTLELTNCNTVIDGTIVLYSITGQNLCTQNEVKRKNFVEMGKYAAGNYILQLTVGGQIKEWQIIKK